jgi:hypothetical protein
MLFDQHLYGLLFLLLPIWHWLTIELLLPLKFGVNLMIGLVVIHPHKHNALSIKRKISRKLRCQSSRRHTKFKRYTSKHCRYKSSHRPIESKHDNAHLCGWGSLSNSPPHWYDLLQECFR